VSSSPGGPVLRRRELVAGLVALLLALAWLGGFREVWVYGAPLGGYVELCGVVDGLVAAAAVGNGSRLVLLEPELGVARLEAGLGGELLGCGESGGVVAAVAGVKTSTPWGSTRWRRLVVVYAAGGPGGEAVVRRMALDSRGCGLSVAPLEGVRRGVLVSRCCSGDGGGVLEVYPVPGSLYYRLVFSGPSLRVEAYDAATGRLVWSNATSLPVVHTKPLPAPVFGEAAPGGGLALEVPLLDGNVAVYILPCRALAAKRPWEPPPPWLHPGASAGGGGGAEKKRVARALADVLGARSSLNVVYTTRAYGLLYVVAGYGENTLLAVVGPHGLQWLRGLQGAPWGAAEPLPGIVVVDVDGVLHAYRLLPALSPPMPWPLALLAAWAWLLAPLAAVAALLIFLGSLPEAPCVPLFRRCP